MPSGEEEFSARDARKEPVSGDDAQQEHDLVRVASAGDNAEASIYRAYLEQHGIHVYVQGENHRSMLGMVGTYIDLYLLVPRHQQEEAAKLLEEFESEAPAPPPEFRGPFRDEFDDEEEDEDDDSWKASAEHKIALRRARLAAAAFPFGGGHLAAGAVLSGLLLLCTSAAGIAMGITRNPALFAMWPIAIAADMLALRGAVEAQTRRRLRRKKERHP